MSAENTTTVAEYRFSRLTTYVAIAFAFCEVLGVLQFALVSIWQKGAWLLIFQLLAAALALFAVVLSRQGKADRGLWLLVSGAFLGLLRIVLEPVAYSKLSFYPDNWYPTFPASVLMPFGNQSFGSWAFPELNVIEIVWGLSEIATIALIAVSIYAVVFHRLGRDKTLIQKQIVPNAPKDKLQTDFIPTSGLAVAALVIAFLAPVIGLILGYIARSEIERSKGALRGESIAKAAIVLGWIFMILVAVIVGVFVFTLPR